MALENATLFHTSAVKFKKRQNQYLCDRPFLDFPSFVAHSIHHRPGCAKLSALDSRISLSAWFVANTHQFTEIELWINMKARFIWVWVWCVFRRDVWLDYWWFDLIQKYKSANKIDFCCSLGCHGIILRNNGLNKDKYAFDVSVPQDLFVVYQFSFVVNPNLLRMLVPEVTVQAKILLDTIRFWGQILVTVLDCQFRRMWLWISEK